MQWKEHGLFGVLMEYAQEHAIALQCIIEQEIILEVQCHVLGMILKLQLAAMVKH